MVDVLQRLHKWHRKRGVSRQKVVWYSHSCDLPGASLTVPATAPVATVLGWLLALPAAVPPPLSMPHRLHSPPPVSWTPSWNSELPDYGGPPCPLSLASPVGFYTIASKSPPPPPPPPPPKCQAELPPLMAPHFAQSFLPFGPPRRAARRCPFYEPLR